MPIAGALSAKSLGFDPFLENCTFLVRKRKKERLAHTTPIESLPSFDHQLPHTVDVVIVLVIRKKKRNRVLVTQQTKSISLVLLIISFLATCIYIVWVIQVGFHPFLVLYTNHVGGRRRCFGLH